MTEEEFEKKVVFSVVCVTESCEGFSVDDVSWILLKRKAGRHITEHPDHALMGVFRWSK